MKKTSLLRLLFLLGVLFLMGCQQERGFYGGGGRQYPRPPHPNRGPCPQCHGNRFGGGGMQQRQQFGGGFQQRGYGGGGYQQRSYGGRGGMPRAPHPYRGPCQNCHGGGGGGFEGGFDD